MDNARNLAVLTSKEYDLQNIITGKGLDIHKLIGKLPRPKKGFVLPGYRYCGPFNPLDEQVDSDGNPLPGHEPYNQVDDICRIHDNAYEKATNLADKHKADKAMLKSLKDMKPKGLREKIDRKVIQLSIGTKRKLGLGLSKDQTKILNNLFHK